MLWWLSVIMYLGTVHQSKLANSGRMSPAASEGKTHRCYFKAAACVEFPKEVHRIVYGNLQQTGLNGKKPIE